MSGPARHRLPQAVRRSRASTTAPEPPRTRRRRASVGAMVPVLLVTSDGGVRDAVVRLAALAGTPVRLEVPGASALAAWRMAGLVLVGPEGAGVASPPRREGVLVVTDRSPSAELWQRALAIGAEQVLGCRRPSPGCWNGSSPRRSPRTRVAASSVWWAGAAARGHRPCRPLSG